AEQLLPGESGGGAAGQGEGVQDRFRDAIQARPANGDGLVVEVGGEGREVDRGQEGEKGVEIQLPRKQPGGQRDDNGRGQQKRTDDRTEGEARPHGGRGQRLEVRGRG